MATTNPFRYCVRCGEQGPFRSDKAARCTACDELAAAERREYAKNYHAARSKAVSRLIRDHHDEFKHYLDAELTATSRPLRRAG